MKRRRRAMCARNVTSLSMCISAPPCLARPMPLICIIYQLLDAEIKMKNGVRCDGMKHCAHWP